MNHRAVKVEWYSTSGKNDKKFMGRFVSSQIPNSVERFCLLSVVRICKAPFSLHIDVRVCIVYKNTYNVPRTIKISQNR
jgi:hypothetical protein